MKSDIHPHYEAVTLTCACGNVVETLSTRKQEDFQIDICGACHPFYTGKAKVMDTAGRIERFNKKYGKKA